jgi:hypothetical protein
LPDFLVQRKKVYIAIRIRIEMPPSTFAIDAGRCRKSGSASTAYPLLRLWSTPYNLYKERCAMVEEFLVSVFANITTWLLIKILTQRFSG